MPGAAAGFPQLNNYTGAYDDIYCGVYSSVATAFLLYLSIPDAPYIATYWMRFWCATYCGSTFSTALTMVFFSLYPPTPEAPYIVTYWLRAGRANLLRIYFLYCVDYGVLLSLPTPEAPYIFS